MKKLFTLNPGPWRWSAGIQAGIAMALPVALFTLLGMQSHGLAASLGGFTALYSAHLPRMDRMRILPLVALGLILASTVGSISAANIWLTYLGLMGVTAAACVLAIGTGLGPPGPIMFVLVAAVSSRIATSPGTVQTTTPELLIPALVSLGALIAYLVVIAPLLIPSVRRSEGKPSTFTKLFPGIRFDRTTGAIAVRVISGVFIASVASWILDSRYFHWMILPTVGILQATHERRLNTIRATQRVLGTIIGAGLFGLIALIGPTGFKLVAIIALFQCAIEIVIARNHGLALIFITPVALTIVMAGRQENVFLIVQDRIFDTLVGALIAILVFWVWERLRAHKEPQPEKA